ncbi:minor capsid protein [Jeotgalibaca porci]|uniref:phage head morphogenesis protein n=1 Tax=Jeotgalibaca porci TaxID=1868793 RepID=UPI00359F1F4E
MAKKTPKTIYPNKAEQTYARNLQKHFRVLGSYILSEFDSLAKEIDSEAEMRSVRGDININQRINNLMKKIKKNALGYVDEKEVGKDAARFLKNVNAVNKSNTSTQIGARGINPVASESWLSAFMNQKIKENVGYITTIRSETLEKVEEIITEAVNTGKSSVDIRKQLTERVGISENRAKFIARDQTGSVLGQLNAARHTENGIRAYRWRDSDDLAVRDSHKERDGKIYFYADGEMLPGEDYNCRCVAEPVFDEELVELGLLDPSEIYSMPAAVPEAEESPESSEERQWELEKIEIREAIKKGAELTVDEIKDVGSKLGSRIEEEIKKTYDERLYEYNKMAEKYKKDEEKIQNVIERSYLDKLHPDYVERSVMLEMADQLNKDGDALHKLYYTLIDTREEIATKRLKEFRELGSGKMDFSKRSSTENKKVLNYVIQHLPKSWVDAFKSETIYSPQVKRGYHRKKNESFRKTWKELGYTEKDLNSNKYLGSYYTTIALSGSGERNKRRVTFHELAHLAENLLPHIKEKEHEFYASRTEGELTQWMGEGYDKHEVARKDNFIDLYMGKDYGNTKESSYELLSMGIESVFSGSYDLTEDPDYMSFVYGMLFTQ